MIRTLIKLGLLALVCMVIYNYFFGSESEKATSKRIFQGVGSVFTEIKGLVQSEKGKFDGGKYDTALTKMQDVLDRLKSHAQQSNDGQLQRQVAQLEQRKAAIAKQVDAVPTDTGFQKAADQAKKVGDMAKQVENLTNDIQALVNSVATPAEQ